MQKWNARSRRLIVSICGVLLSGLWCQVQAQPDDRIQYNDQALWLSGGNVAWVNFARDIGPGTTELGTFEEIFQQLHENGGNAMRLWLHTTGAVTPAWDGNTVVGPGEGAIDDLEAILDLAWEHEVGLVLCLWSFDMLRISNGTNITDRAYALLTDPDLTQRYIDNALVPMVDSLKGHPGIVAWEIFNEPEGMSNEHGWNFNRHVPMSAIQRFINMTAGAIHRADPEAQVTNGSWAFIASSDTHTDPGKRADQLAPAEVERIQRNLSLKYRHEFSIEETKAFYNALQANHNYNYYRDDRLIAEGGDEDGTLDFYTVHYYEWAGTALSPFHHDKDYWGLSKPLAIAEFFMGGGADGNPDEAYGVSWESMFTTLYDRGYAGAMAWQWFNYPVSAEGVVNWPRILESTQTMWGLHRADVDVIFRGIRINTFTAEPMRILPGESTTLTWDVTGADSVTINGEAVDSVGTQTVTLDETTTFTLEARRDTLVASQTLTVQALTPESINRAFQQPAVASTIETCCGDPLPAELAVDGDPNTRWSSEWQDGLADDDPDDEWIYVDLGEAYDIQRVVLLWEVAYGASYDIDVSYDAQLWTTVHEERSGDGGTDEITFDTPVSARYVRMQGLERGTEYGYSLWELEVYGLPASQQPPEVALMTPADGAVLEPGADVTLTADAADPDGTAQEVAFYADDELLGTATAAPFTITWAGVTEGEYTLSAVVTDDDGLAVSSIPFPVFVNATDGFSRYEAEDASYEGDVTVQNASSASGGSYLDMRNSGTITFDVIVDRAGEYMLAFGYNLAYDVPKHQDIVVNADTLRDLRFNGAMNVWQERGVKVSLQGGSNTIEVLKVWGWMYFDYLAVSGDVLNVAVEDRGAVPSAFSLANNYPNPFNPETVIAYELPEAVEVQLEVFDVTGRRVTTLVDGLQPAGTYTVRFEADNLASGVYLYRLHAGSFVQTKPMVLMR